MRARAAALCALLVLLAIAHPTTANATPADPPAQIAVVLAVDTSGSMAGSGIAAALAAASAYAKNLPAEVKVGLVTFSAVPHTLLAPTTDRSALNAALSRVHAAGPTALYDGIVAAAATMASLPPGSVRRLVILSDGKDTSSKHSLSDAKLSLVSAGIAADVVAFRLPGDRAVLDQIATTSHGRVLPAANAGELATAFDAAAQALRRAEAAAAAQAIHPPSESVSQTTLWATLAVAFVAILTVALLALWGPATSAARASKRARLAEVNRYRLRGTLGQTPTVAAATPTQSNLTKGALALVDKSVRSRGQRDRIVDELERSGVRMRPEEWAAVQILAIVFAAAMTAVLVQSPIGLVLGGVLGWAGARVFMRTKISRRANAFMDQLPDTLQLVAGSLRSGFSLNQALASVVSEGTEPTASEFARALAEVRLGSDLEDAVDGVARRMRCDDLTWVVMAVRISREVGGNLAEVLGNTVTTMRERAQLRGLVRVLSAEGRISAKVLIALPFLLAAYLLVFKSGYLNPLVNTAVGITMLVAGSTLLLLGALWLSRLVKIEV